jgi:hypothetical protein
MARSVRMKRTMSTVPEAPSVPASPERRLDDPIDDRLLDHFYHPETKPEHRPRPAPVKASSKPPAPRPTHYKICCISLYTSDIERLEEMVAELKRRGHTKANKSQLIRAALDQIDLSKVPKSY